MTDITGNFGVNAHNYQREDIGTKRAHVCPSCDEVHEESPKQAIDLDKNPAALSGKAMIKTNGAKAKEGAYVFDPKKVEEDLQEFQAIWTVKESMDEYKQALIDKGYEETAAQEKAAVYAACLLSVQNV